jgi:hypothetical protein
MESREREWQIGAERGEILRALRVLSSHVSRHEMRVFTLLGLCGFAVMPLLTSACSSSPSTGTTSADGGTPDATKADAGKADAGKADAAKPDAAKPDAGKQDAAKPDAGQADAAKPDAGSPDAASSGDGSMHACTPKSGFDVAVPGSSPLSSDEFTAMVLDDAGDPQIAFIAEDPNGDGNQSEDALYFVAYDDATCTWKTPVMVDTVGDVDSTRDREVTIARDASTGQLAIGYQVVGRLSEYSTQVMLAQSGNGGSAWTSEEIASDEANMYTNDTSVDRATVAMRNGKTFFAYFESSILAGSESNDSDADGFYLLSRTGTSGAFSGGIVPPVAGATLPGAESIPPGLAIDDAGNAGFLYYAHTDDTTGNLRVCYYASTQPSAVAVFDSEGMQNDSPDLVLAFEGNKPRIAATLMRGATDATAVWFSASDDGVTWGAPVQIPRDGGDGMGSDLSLALDGTGNPSVALRLGSTSGSSTCGRPKLATGVGLTSFTTCGPALNDPIYGDGFVGDNVQLAFAPSGKRVMAFAASSDDTIKGLIVWREP